MGIDSQGISSYRIQNDLVSFRDVSTRGKKPGSSVESFLEEKQKISESASATSSVEVPSKEATSTLPMSAYLSREEKEMLHVLFPPSGLDVGVRAYRRNQEPVGPQVAVGQRIDLKT